MTCKIALVDSGIDLELYKENVIEFIDYVKDENDNFVDDVNGHGTLCCSALFSENKNVNVVAVKVLDESNHCSSDTLISALEQLVEIDVNIINLSLCTSNLLYKDKYIKVIKKLCQQGKLLVASNSNKDKVSIPAVLPQVIGVTGNIFFKNDDYWYSSTKDIQCIADKKAILLKGKNERYELFGGNSKATALFAGIISNHWSELIDCNFNKIEKIIIKDAKKTFWKEEERIDEIPNLPTIQKDCQLFNKLENLLIDIFELTKNNISKLYTKKLYNLGVNRYNAIDLIQRIEEQLNIKIDYTKVNEYWFYSIDLLYSYIIDEKMRLKNE